MAHNGLHDLEYPQSVDRGKKIKHVFNCSQNATPSRLPSPIADIEPLRHFLPTVNSRYQTTRLLPLITPSDHLLNAPDILYTHLAVPLTPSSCSDEHSTSLPCWERLTSNPGPTSQASPSCSPHSSISSHSNCNSDLQFVSSCSTSSAESEPSNMAESLDNDADDKIPTPTSTRTRPLKRKSRPKRKYTHLLLDDANCAKPCCRSKADCIHTSEIIDSGGDTIVPETISDISLPKAKEARMECETLLEGIVYLGDKAMSDERVMDVLLEREMGGDEVGGLGSGKVGMGDFVKGKK